MILSCPAAEKGELSHRKCLRAWRARKGVPVIVDAAAETLTIPNIHLAHGANMVAYSGGKCLRGPQAAGLLLGQKDLVRAAWINSAPHHAFGRSLKVGKEEIMGMLAAVEMWVKRDHDAEWKQWQAWLDNIAEQATQVTGRHHRDSAARRPLEPCAALAPALGCGAHRHHRHGGGGDSVARAAAHRGGRSRAARGAIAGRVRSPSCPT